MPVSLHSKYVCLRRPTLRSKAMQESSLLIRSHPRTGPRPPAFRRRKQAAPSQLGRSRLECRVGSRVVGLPGVAERSGDGRE